MHPSIQCFGTEAFFRCAVASWTNFSRITHLGFVTILPSFGYVLLPHPLPRTSLILQADRFGYLEPGPLTRAALLQMIEADVLENAEAEHLKWKVVVPGAQLGVALLAEGPRHALPCI